MVSLGDGGGTMQETARTAFVTPTVTRQRDHMILVTARCHASSSSAAFRLTSFQMLFTESLLLRTDLLSLITTHSCTETSWTGTLAGRGVSKARVLADVAVSWGTKLTLILASGGFGVPLRFSFGCMCVLGHALTAWQSYLLLALWTLGTR